MSEHHTTNTPVLGLALSGAAARSAFYIGFLEVLREAGVPIQVIAAQSGASVVASAFVCNTLPVLKDFMFNLNWKNLRALLKRGTKEGGLYSLTRVEEQMRIQMTHGKRFEDLDTKLVFAATNLNTGEVIPLAMGDLARAIHATCAVPGLFAPVRWGNFLLIDGGLLSVIPGQLARDAGATVVIGVDAKATRHIFMKSHIELKARYNKVRDFVRKSVPSIARGLSPEGVQMQVYTNEYGEERRTARITHVLARSLDLAAEAIAKPEAAGELHGCDLIISEGLGKFGDSMVLSEGERVYLDGRRAATQNLPLIWKLLEQHGTSPR